MVMKKGRHRSQTLGSGLTAEDLRTLAKAMQNRMWKIEFTKQLSIELISVPFPSRICCHEVLLPPFHHMQH